ncbi:MAG: flagellar assembly protein FliH [Azoarcus sp.]|jgi:flagellar assembly protein FliH|nr:flagellar assembly protein FliH [Azoarcus sp.]
MEKTVTLTQHQATGAYRRWEPPAFDAPPPPEPLPTSAAPEAADEPSPALPPGLHLPTVAEIEQMHDEARRGGYEEGFAEGRRQGHGEGLQTGLEEGCRQGYAEGVAAARDEAERLRALFTRLDQALARLDAEIAEELMSLAIELARKVLQHTLTLEPEAVVNVVRAALRHLPQNRTHIHLHPDDVALARKHLGDALDQGEHLLIEDIQVSRGGCRVDTESAQVDATMETRWRRVLESLGRPHAPWGKEKEADRKTVATREISPPETPRPESAGNNGENDDAPPADPQKAKP